MDSDITSYPGGLKGFITGELSDVCVIQSTSSMSACKHRTDRAELLVHRCPDDLQRPRPACLGHLHRRLAHQQRLTGSGCVHIFWWRNLRRLW